jgi:radical SAM protein with 4Fe4S-binding SPASM domain
MVLHAHSQGHKIRVFTTLVGMRPKDVRRLGAVPFDVFTVHLASEPGLQNISVDKKYLHVLEMLNERKVPTDYVYYGDALHPEIAAIVNDEARKETLCSRAGNLKHIDSLGNFPRRRGRIGCLRQLRQNVLLPNGDVVLCCMDYGMKHHLGNLVTDAYADLFDSHEFQRVRTGMEDPTIDILCRACDLFSFEKEDPCR